MSATITAGTPADILAPKRIDGAEIAALKEARDNSTNIFYLGQVYVIMLGTIALATWFFTWQQAGGTAFWWNIPVALAAILVIGASQHQLGGATHEATHFTLFRNRLANERVSDWLCMFPLYSTTYQFRLHHLAHHQFVNDPDRDPDYTQLRDSGHDLDFPLPHVEFLKALASQLWLLNLVRYTLTRARYNGLGVDHNPYRDDKLKGSRLPNVAIGLYAVVIPIALGIAKPFIGAWAVVAVLAGSGLAIIGLLARFKEAEFPASHIKPVISHRTTAISRMVYFTLLYSAIGTVEATTVIQAWTYYLVLWVLPLFTTFAFFMVMRQWVQHGNADRGRLTNTRTFLVHPVIRYAVFPFGMDYHLPHHIYAAVPHFKLPALHELLMKKDPTYARDGIVVEGYFRSPAPERGNPTVLDVLGPNYARRGDEVFIASDALDQAEIVDKAHIKAHEEKSVKRGMDAPRGAKREG